MPPCPPGCLPVCWSGWRRLRPSCWASRTWNLPGAPTARYTGELSCNVVRCFGCCHYTALCCCTHRTQAYCSVKCKDDAWGEYQSLFADSQVLEKIKATAGTGASRPLASIMCIHVLRSDCVAYPADLTLFVVRLLARLESGLRQEANLFDDVRFPAVLPSYLRSEGGVYGVRVFCFCW